LLAAAAPVVAFAQATKPAKPAEAPKLPPPVVVGGNELKTRDGVLLKADFYPSTKGKEAVPVILLHMWKGDRKELTHLALYLQNAGHAVLVPDLRGHGESTRVQMGNVEKTLDGSKLLPDDFSRMVRFDMETLKAYLLKKNHEGELNIEKLCVVGAEMGALVGLDWARLDWSWPTLADRKQGQDVKALVLLSPQWVFPGLNARAAMSHPAVLNDLSVLIIAAGEDSRAASEARRMHAVWERYHPEPPEAKAVEKKDLFLFALKTKLPGTKMLDIRELEVESMIAEFIDVRLVKQSFPWKDRN
jgi:pimeloyl-ACP methyl ester carboxylesterase